MSDKDNYIYCNEEKKIIGTYIHCFRPSYIDFRPIPGVSVNDTIKAALDLAKCLKTKVKLTVNGITLSVPASVNMTVQELRREYLRLSRSR